MNKDELKKKKALVKPMIFFIGGIIVFQALILLLLKSGIFNFAVALIIDVLVTGAAVASIFTMMMHMLNKLSLLVDGDDSNDNDPVLEKLAARQDDLGEMVRSMQQYISNIGNVLHAIKKATEELGDVTAQLETSFDTMDKSVTETDSCINSIAGSAKTQVASTVSMKDKIDRMNKATDTIIHNIDTLNESVVKVRECNTNAAAIMDELVQISRSSSEAMAQVKEQAAKTNASVNEIHAATDIITGIAAQTNLLALNASIEAARAGDQGRGFAVVADEIRVLADQSKESAGKIASVVDALIANSKTSFALTDKVAASVEEQIGKINATERIFNELKDEINTLTGSIGQIDTEVKGLTTHKSSLESGISELEASAYENTENAATAASNANALHNDVSTCTKMKEQVVNVSSDLTTCMKKLSGMRNDIKDIGGIKGKLR